MDRFDDMGMFQIIARTGTISAAAAELNVAPSAVSRRLKGLEERLGVQLVQRTTRKLTLTAAGEAYLDGARGILHQLDELEGTLRAGAGTLSGSLRVTAPLSFGIAALPDILDSFIRQNPDVEIDLHLTDARVDLVADGYDLALRIGELGNSTLIARKLCEIDFVLCASPDFLKAHPELKSPADLDGIPACIYTGESHQTTLRWVDPAGKRGQVVVDAVFRANNGDILRELAARGHGIVWAPRFILYPAISRGDLTPLFEGYSWADSNLYAVYPPTPHMPARLRALIDHFADRLKGGTC